MAACAALIAGVWGNVAQSLPDGHAGDVPTADRMTHLLRKRQGGGRRRVREAISALDDYGALT